MSNFFTSMRDTMTKDVNYNCSITENGAVGYKTSGKALLDVNFATSSLRHMDENEIYKRFADAYFENPVLAITWLFFLRDIRGGMGERRSFNIIINALANDKSKLFKSVIPFIAEYGRWDDVLSLMNTPFEADAVSLIKAQINEDYANYQDGKSVSLCAKWLPSVNASSNTRAKAVYLIKRLGISEPVYRKTLSALRSRIDVIERKMASGEWDEIEYSAVPSRANLIYKDAFLRHDIERRTDYLESLKKGETKINAGTLFPCDIVYKAEHGYDATVEALWNALPNYVGEDGGDTIVVADGSGSMYCTTVMGSSVKPLDVANSLAIYFAEKLHGDFANKYITFSNRPQLVDFSTAKNLKEKLCIAHRYTECANTNIVAVFDLILNTAIRGRMAQRDIPQNILIISDMEFDRGARFDVSLFGEITQKYKNAGYKLPRLVFWNVCGRTLTIPLVENDCGFALVSGFSPAIADMVLSGELDPYKNLVNKLTSERYAPVYNVLSGKE